MPSVKKARREAKAKAKSEPQPARMPDGRLAVLIDGELLPVNRAPWAPNKPDVPSFATLPPIFSGPDSDLLWKSIARLGANDMTAMDVYVAAFQLASSMQALEARLVSEFKKKDGK
jgi:hypothetical protein